MGKNARGAALSNGNARALFINALGEREVENFMFRS